MHLETPVLYHDLFPSSSQHQRKARRVELGLAAEGLSEV